MADLVPQQTPQFNKAEYLGQPGSQSCAFCSGEVTHQYYRINGALACPACALNAQRSLPNDTHAAFVRALLFGAGGAVLGLVLYAAVEIATGWIIGYVALAVGFIVAKAMLMGSNGIGGRRYQIAAVLLTYAAVSMAAVPVAIHQNSKSAVARNQGNTGQEGSQTPTTENSAEPEKPAMSPLAAIGYLVGIGLASPFMDLANPLGGVLGLVILFVGIRIAWQMMAARMPQIFGPFETASNPPV